MSDAGVAGKAKVNFGRRCVWYGATSCLALLATVSFGPVAMADSVLWAGSANGDWFTNGNWVWDNHTPTAADAARINSDGPRILSGTTGNVGTLLIGTSSAGNLAVEGGLASSSVTLGYAAGGSGTLQVSGGTWTNSGTLIVGNEGVGTVSLNNGATANSGTTYLGGSSGGAGTLTVSGGSTFATTGELFVGYAEGGNTATLTVPPGTLRTASAATANGGGTTGGATVYGASSTQIGAVTSVLAGSDDPIADLDNHIVALIGDSKVTVAGANSSLTSIGRLIVGNAGSALLFVQDGGTVTSGGSVIGRHAASAATVTGSGSTWTTGDMSVGGDTADTSGPLGLGSLSITNAGTVVSTSGRLGNVVGAGGRVTVDGIGSTWQLGNGTLGVGVNGTGILTVEGGATVASGHATIGSNAGARGRVTISGAGSTWTSTGAIYVGNGGIGTLTIGNGAVVSAVDGYVSTLPGSKSA